MGEYCDVWTWPNRGLNISKSERVRKELRREGPKRGSPPPHIYQLPQQTYHVEEKEEEPGRTRNRKSQFSPHKSYFLKKVQLLSVPLTDDGGRIRVWEAQVWTEADTGYHELPPPQAQQGQPQHFPTVVSRFWAGCLF